MNKILKGGVFSNDCESELPAGGKSYSMLAWEDRHNVDKANPEKLSYEDASYLVENDFYFWMERSGHIFVLDSPADGEPYPDIEAIDVKLGLERIVVTNSFRSTIIETLKDLGETSFAGNDLAPNYFVMKLNSDSTRDLVFGRLKKDGYKVFVGVEEDEMLTFFVYGNLSPLAWKDDDDE